MKSLFGKNHNIVKKKKQRSSSFITKLLKTAKASETKIRHCRTKSDNMIELLLTRYDVFETRTKPK